MDQLAKDSQLTIRAPASLDPQDLPKQRTESLTSLDHGHMVSTHSYLTRELRSRLDKMVNVHRKLEEFETKQKNLQQCLEDLGRTMSTVKDVGQLSDLPPIAQSFEVLALAIIIAIQIVNKYTMH